MKHSHLKLVTANPAVIQERLQFFDTLKAEMQAIAGQEALIESQNNTMQQKLGREESYLRDVKAIAASLRCCYSMQDLAMPKRAREIYDGIMAVSTKTLARIMHHHNISVPKSIHIHARSDTTVVMTPAVSQASSAGKTAIEASLSSFSLLQSESEALLPTIARSNGYADYKALCSMEMKALQLELERVENQLKQGSIAVQEVVDQCNQILQNNILGVMIQLQEAFDITSTPQTYTAHPDPYGEEWDLVAALDDFLQQNHRQRHMKRRNALTEMDPSTMPIVLGQIAKKNQGMSRD